MNKNPEIVIVAALARNGVIGHEILDFGVSGERLVSTAFS